MQSSAIRSPFRANAFPTAFRPSEVGSMTHNLGSAQPPYAAIDIPAEPGTSAAVRNAVGLQTRSATVRGKYKGGRRND